MALSFGRRSMLPELGAYNCQDGRFNTNQGWNAPNDG